MIDFLIKLFKKKYPLLFINFFKQVNPNPINKLNKGPAIEPANPISPYPDLARVQFNNKSYFQKINFLPEAEFPYDNKVKAKKVAGIFKINPSVFKIFIKKFAINHIQIMDIIKLKKLII